MQRQLELILKLKDQATAQLKRMGGALDGTIKGFKGAMSSVFNFKNAIVGVIGSAVIGQVAEYGDKIQNMNNRLIAVTGSQEKANAEFEKLYQIAQRSRGGLEATISSFARFELANRNMGGTTAETEQMVENLNKGLTLYGATAEEVGSVTLQLSQAFGSGVLQGDEFRSIAEAFPPLLDELAKKLNVSRGELKQMGADGKITSQVIKDTLIGMTDELNKEFEEMPITIGQAMTGLKNTFLSVMRDVGQSTGIFDSMSQAVANFTKWIDENRQEIAYWATITIGVFKTVAITVWNVIQILLRNNKFLTESFIKTWGVLADIIKAAFSGNFDEIGGLVAEFKDNMGQNFGELKDGIVTDFNDIGTAWKDQMDLPNKFYNSSAAAKDLSSNIGGVANSFQKTSKEVESFAKKLNKLWDDQKKKIKEIKQDLKDLKKEFKEEEKKQAQDLATNIAQVIVDKEDELAQVKEEYAKADTEEKKAELQKQITDLETFLANHQADIAENQAQIAEIRRQAGLDEIERLKEEYELAKAERKKDYEERKEELKDYLDEVKKEYKKKLKELKEEIAKAGLDYIEIRAEAKGGGSGEGGEKKLKGGNKKKGKPAHYAEGTNSVPMDGYAFLHKGEQVIPARNQGEPYEGKSKTIVNNFTFKDSIVTSQRDLEDMIDKIMRKKINLAN